MVIIMEPPVRMSGDDLNMLTDSRSHMSRLCNEGILLMMMMTVIQSHKLTYEGSVSSKLCDKPGVTNNSQKPQEGTR